MAEILILFFFFPQLSIRPLSRVAVTIPAMMQRDLKKIFPDEDKGWKRKC